MCDETQAIEKFTKGFQYERELQQQDDSNAWDCKCGIVVCGECKDEWNAEFGTPEEASLSRDRDFLR